MVSYRVMLDVPRELIWFVSRLLAGHRREIGTRRGTRRLDCYKQAVFRAGLVLTNYESMMATVGMALQSATRGARSRRHSDLVSVAT